MPVIQIVKVKGWTQLWMECDSSLVVQAISNPGIVPWRLRVMWRNCIVMSSSFNFRISHVFREANHCADKLANFGVLSKRFTRWNLISNFIRMDFFRNRWGLPNFRFK